MRFTRDSDEDAYETGHRPVRQAMVPSQPVPVQLPQGIQPGTPISIHIHMGQGQGAMQPDGGMELPPVEPRPWKYSKDGMKWAAGATLFWLVILVGVGFGIWWAYDQGYLNWVMPKGGH